MFTDSVSQVAQVAIHFAALIVVLLFSQCLKEVYSSLRKTLPGIQRRGAFPPRDTGHLYQWIRQIRKDHGWSQEILAEYLEVDVRTVQRMEAGEKFREKHIDKLLELQTYGRLIDIEDHTRYDVHTSSRSGWCLFFILVLGLILLALLIWFILLHHPFMQVFCFLVWEQHRRTAHFYYPDLRKKSY